MIPPSIATRFSEKYNVRYPIACAGMAFVGTCIELPRAVNAAGGIGSFGVGVMPPPSLAPTAEQIRASGAGPVHFNFATPFCSEAHIAACEEIKPEIVSFHWGHPSPDWINRLNAVNTDVWEQVGNVADGIRARDDGIAVIVAQGSESGGHNYGRLPTMVLVPEMVRACEGALILAAGGIVTGHAIAAALALGADGVWMGSRFAASEEANVPQAYYDKVIAAVGEDVVLTSVYGRDMPFFNPMRIVRNEIIDEWGEKENEAPNDPSSQPVIGTTVIGGETVPVHLFSTWLATRGATGEFDKMPMLVGQGVGMIDDAPPVAEIMNRLVEQYAAATATLTQGLV